MLITLASLFHDIGKFYQRTNLNHDISSYVCFLVKRQNKYCYQHAAFTALFIDTFIHQDFRGFLELSSSHHANKLTIVKKADIISSSHDRRDSNYQDEDDENLITKRLYSIFNEIKIDEVKIFQTVKIEELDHFKGFYVKKHINYQDSIKTYQKLFIKLCKEVANIGYNTYESLHHRIYPIIENYTFAIPANTYHSNFPTVGLFDHLKLTTAIANCLHKTNQRKPFVIVKYKLKNISKYVFYDDDLEKINSRSLFVNLLSDFICYKIINDFGLTYENVLYSISGQGRLLLYNTNEINAKLKKIFGEIVAFVNIKQLGIINFVLSYDIYDEQKLMQGTFKNQVDDNEKYVFQNDDIIENKKIEYIDFIYDFKTYAFDYHQHQWQNEKYLSFDNFGKIIFNPLNLYDDGFYFTVNKHQIGEIKYLCNINKLHSNSKLSLLMMDIDKLRLIFKDGIENSKQSISKFLTLSRYLEVFFGKIVLQIAQEYTDINLIYSGGDNIIIITPKNNTIKLINHINSYFHNYIGNNQAIKLKYDYEELNNSIYNTYMKVKERLKRW